MSTQSPSTPKPQKLPRPQKYPNNIRTAIQRSPWKFYQVAEKTKIPRDTLSDYCADKYPVPNDRRDALAELLQCLPEYLVPPLPNIREAYWSQSQYEETKDLEALFLLRNHCHLHPTDENALQQLMELLAKVGRYPEMEKWYERFLKELQKEDIWRTPDADTTELLAQLRAKRSSTSCKLSLEKAGQGVQTDEEVTQERATFTKGSSVPSGSGGPLPPGQASTTHAERIDETVFLTIAIPSAHIQALTQGSQSEQKIPAAPSTSGTPPFPSPDQIVSTPSQGVSPQGILGGGEGANEHSLDAKNLRGCSLVSSTDIVPSLKIYGSLCQEELTTCWQQIDIYETIEQRRTMNDEHIRDLTRLTRRDLFTLASVSSSLLLNMRRGWPTAGILEEFSFRGNSKRDDLLVLATEERWSPCRRVGYSTISARVG